jgi:hypothetical protein
MKYSKEFKVQIGLTESATDADVDARLADLQAAENRARTAEADPQKSARKVRRRRSRLASIAANAQVDAWEREGLVSGNATAKLREVYVAAATGAPVTKDMIAGMVAALPKLDTTRIAEEAKPSQESQDVRERRRQRSPTSRSPAATSRHRAEDRGRGRRASKTNANFTRDDLRRELAGSEEEVDPRPAVSNTFNPREPPQMAAFHFSKEMKHGYRKPRKTSCRVIAEHERHEHARRRRSCSRQSSIARPFRASASTGRLRAQHPPQRRSQAITAGDEVAIAKSGDVIIEAGAAIADAAEVMVGQRRPRRSRSQSPARSTRSASVVNGSSAGAAGDDVVVELYDYAPIL